MNENLATYADDAAQSLLLIDISKSYGQKAALERELPTTTQKLITTNDCILSSVVALLNGASKVVSLLTKLWQLPSGLPN